MRVVSVTMWTNILKTNSKIDFTSFLKVGHGISIWKKKELWIQYSYKAVIPPYINKHNKSDKSRFTYKIIKSSTLVLQSSVIKSSAL